MGLTQVVNNGVRTLLARRVINTEALNTVALYLPHYHTKGLQQLVDKLSKPDADIMPPVDVQLGDETLDFHKAEGSAEAFGLLSSLPSYFVPRKQKASQVRRLMMLARQLAYDEIDEQAIDAAKQAVLDVLKVELAQVRDTESFQDVVEERAKVEIEAVNWDVGAENTREGDKAIRMRARARHPQLFVPFRTFRATAQAFFLIT